MEWQWANPSCPEEIGITSPRPPGSHCHRIETLQFHTMIHSHGLSSKCCCHVPSQCVYERHSPPERPPFWICSGGEWNRPSVRFLFCANVVWLLIRHSINIYDIHVFWINFSWTFPTP
jgi:hypothetical protein